MFLALLGLNVVFVTAGYALLTVLLGCPLPDGSRAGQSRASERNRPEWLVGYAERAGVGLMVVTLDNKSGAEEAQLIPVGGK